MNANDIDIIKTLFFEAYQENQDKIDDLILTIKDSTETQITNFRAVMEAFKSGMLNIKKNNSALDQTLHDVIDVNSKSATKIVDLLKKSGFVKDGKDEDLTKLLNEKIYSSTDSIESLSAGYSDLQEIIQAIRDTHDEINDTVENTTITQRKSLGVIQDSLSGLSNELDVLKQRFRDVSGLGKGINLDFLNIKGTVHDIVTDSAKLISNIDSNFMSSLENNDDLFKESSNFKSQLGGNSFEVLGKSDLNIESALKEIQNEFAYGRERLNLQLDQFSDSLKDILLETSGYEVTFDDSGKKLLSSTNNGSNKDLTEEESTVVIKNIDSTVEKFKILSKLSSITSFTSGDLNNNLEERLKLANELYDIHVLEGKLDKLDKKNNTELLDYLDKYVEQSKIELDQLDDTQKMLLAINTAASNIVYTQNEILGNREAELNILSKYNNAIQKVSRISSEMQNTITDSLGMLPNFVQKLIGSDEIISNIEKSFSSANAAFRTDLLENGKSINDSLSTYGKTLAESLMAGISPLTILIVGLTLLTTLTLGIVGNIKDISEQLGISKAEAAKLYDQMLQMESVSGNIAVTQERILAIQQSHIDKYGTILDLQSQESKNVVETASLISSAYGVAADQAYEMIDGFTKLGASTELAESLSAATMEAASLAKISPKIIQKDLVEGAEDITKYFGNMPKEAARAVVELRRMGSNIKTVGQIIQNTWNVESFMGNMYELAALTGGQIDLTNVFNAGIQNDVLGVQTALVDAVGSLDEFNSMTAQQKSMLANTIGMSVTEIGNMMAISEANLNLTKEEQEALNSQLATMGDISSLSKEQLESRAKEFAATESMSMAWNRIKATLTRSLLPLVEVFSGVLVAISPILDILGLGFKIIGLIIKPFIPALKFVSYLIGLASGKLTEGLQILDGWVLKAEGIGNGMGEWIKIGGSFLLLGGLMISQWSKIGSLVSGIFTAPMSMLKGMSGMLGKVMGFGKGGTDIASTITSTITKDTSSTVMDKIKNVSKNIFSSKSAVDTSMSSENVSKSIKGEGSFIDNFSSKFISFKDKIKGGITELLDFIKTSLNGIANAIMEPLKTVSAGIGKMMENLLSGLANGLNKFSTKSIMGAGSLLILSGALWVTSKALNQFNTVDWESLAKAGVALIGLAGVAMLLGSAVPAMLLGALAIAALGVALIPTAYALNMFNDVEWESLLKGIAALGAFSLAASAIAFIAPAILIGSAAIAALGASVYIFSMGIEKLNPGVLTLAESFGMLFTSIENIPNALNAIDIDKFKDISDIGVNINKKTSGELTTASAQPTALVTPQVSNVINNQSSSTNNEKNINNYNSYKSNDNSNKIEMLLQKLIDVTIMSVQNPVPAVIGPNTVKEIGKEIRRNNNL